MKKFLCFLLIITISLLPTANVISAENESKTNQISLKSPEGEQFEKAKEILFLAKNNSYKYTSTEEQALKILIKENYKWNEKFFSDLIKELWSNKEKWLLSLEEIFLSIPKWTPISIFENQDSNIWKTLLDASFEIQWKQKLSGMLEVIDSKIKNITKEKCNEKYGYSNYTMCQNPDTYFEEFLPSKEELYKEKIYFNWKSILIGSIKDEFNYEIIKSQSDINRWKILELKTEQSKEFAKLINHTYLKYYTPEFWDFTKITESDKKLLFPDNKISIPELDKKVLNHCIETVKSSYNLNFYIDFEKFLTKNKNQPRNLDLENFIKNYKPNTSLSNKHTCIYEAKKEWLEKLQKNWKIPNQVYPIIYNYKEKNKNISYKLSYTKEFFTLEEAKKSIKETPSNQELAFVKNVTTFDENNTLTINCNDYKDYFSKSKCTQLIGLLRNVALSLNVYNLDYDKYPENINELEGKYIKSLSSFNKDFSYKSTKNWKWFEIKYIWENLWKNTEEKEIKQKDYLSLLGNQKIPEIPEIFSYIPNDDMMIFVKNPSEFWQLLSENNSIFPKFENFSSSESVKNFIKKFFITENFEEISQNLKTSFAIVVENIDITSPEIVMIFDKNEKKFFENKNFKIKEKDNFIFVSKHEKNLENFLKKIENNTLEKSWDFQYVWTKKSEKIQWAFVFVGDKFFEKIIQFENFVLTFRKINDYKEFLEVQQEFWAYEKAFGKPINDIKKLSKIPENSKDLYYIENNILNHKNLGNISNILPLSENNYSLEKISKNEIDNYKYSILNYKEIWQESLDPMGIVLNSKNNGIEIDFFMTPIPDISKEFKEIIDIFKNISRENLDFENKIQIKNWLGSFNFGFDEEKLQKAISSRAETKTLYSVFSSKILWWKNIFDFIKWEFAFFAYDIEDDIFAIENIENSSEKDINFWKIHAGIAISLQSVEKWKELISIFKNQIEKTWIQWEDKTIFDKIFNPQIEKYNNFEIYSVKNIIPELNESISFSYTFLNDFFIISPNQETIKKIIDENKNPAKIQNNQEKYKLFSLKINGKNIEKKIWNIFEKFKEKNEKIIIEIIQEIADDFNFYEINSFLSVYYANKIFDEKISGKFKDFSQNFGDIQLFSKDKKFFIQTDSQKLLKNIQEYSHSSNKISKTFDENFYEDLNNWIEIDNPIINNKLAILITFNWLVPILKNLKNEQNLKNFSFDFILNTDEIGFILEYSDKNPENTNQENKIIDKIFSNNSILSKIIFASIISIIAIFGWFLIFRKLKKRKENTII